MEDSWAVITVKTSFVKYHSNSYEKPVLHDENNIDLYKFSDIDQLDVCIISSAMTLRRNVKYLKLCVCAGICVEGGKSS